LLYENITKALLLYLKTFIKPYHDKISLEYLIPIVSWNAEMLFALTLLKLGVMSWPCVALIDFN
jgi:hypothetical protein